MKNGMLKSFLLGGKSLTGKTGVLAAVAGAAIGIIGTIAECAISKRLMQKADDDIEAEEAKEIETGEEVEVNAEEVKDEETKEG